MKKPLPLLFAAALTIAPVASHAGGLAVYDAVNNVQTTLTASRTLKQYEQMLETYKTQLDELDQAVRQVESLTGSRGIGELLNNKGFKDARRYAPSNWSDTIGIVEAGDLPNSARDFRKIYQDMSDRYAIGGASEYNRNDEEASNAKAFEDLRNSNYAAGAVSRVSFDKTNSRLENYEGLMGAIENAPDIKASTDLVARIVAENGTLSAEYIRLLTTQMQRDTAAENQRLVDATNMKRMTRFENYRIDEIPTQ